MQLLIRTLGVGAAVMFAVAVSALVATQSVTRPLGAPQVGPNETGHHHDSDRSLWSRDRDSVDRPTLRNWTGDDAPKRSLAATTDVPFNRPPGAVGEWNRDVVSDFPSFRTDTSVYPSVATPVDGTYVRDAYVEIFAVQPSTIVRATPDIQPHYAAPNGELFATLDYRFVVPEDSSTPYNNETWQLQAHNVSRIHLLVDGEPEAERPGTRVATLEYDLAEHPGTDHTLTIETNVTVSLQRHHEWCSNLTAGNCTEWSSETTNITESVTVSDSIDVTEYTLDVSGSYARFPDGDLGIFVYKDDPWLGYELPGGRINGIWRFYSARDPGWDQLVTATADGKSVDHSPIHPLQLSAYPIKTGPTASPVETVSIRDVYGWEYQPPSLPGTVHLDVLEQPYRGSFRLAAHFQTPNQTISDLTAYGLVHGVKTDTDPEAYEEIPIHRSNLTLDVLNTTSETATVRITLTDAQTGDPIATEERDGYVMLAGERVQTGSDGTLTKTIDRPAGAISARYEPKHWWLHSIGYVGDSDASSVQGTVLTIVRWIYRAGVPVSLFLLAVFFIDRITGMPIWPPWRGL
ncbi:hypothetical protein [Halosimplex amylolyticum]|uniref:hypothetical protein n=1 Tax=Halosimplex amylolyticum TaxID=3396616 RepID=UPI003F55FF07